jgi:hypothetical protein
MTRTIYTRIARTARFFGGLSLADSGSAARYKVENRLTRRLFGSKVRRIEALPMPTG